MARLPVPGSDNGTWGDILNTYLLTSLNSDGTLKSGSVTDSSITDGSISQSKISGLTSSLAAKASTTDVSTAITNHEADSDPHTTYAKIVNTDGASGRTIFVGSTTPSGQVVGDVWIDSSV